MNKKLDATAVAATQLSDRRAQYGLVIAFVCGMFGIFIGAAWSTLFEFVHDKSIANPTDFSFGAIVFTNESVFLSGSAVLIMLWIFHIVDAYMKIAVLPTRNLRKELLARVWKKLLYFVVLLGILFATPVAMGASPAAFLHGVLLLAGWMAATLYYIFLIFQEY